MAGNIPGKSMTPIFGFGNVNHVDKADKLFKSQLALWIAVAEAKKWKSVVKLLNYRGCGLPTTCGYQFAFREKASYKVHAFFGMDGLGLAVALQDSVAHHFMGSLFSHNTCLCFCEREDGMVTASNSDNSFLLIGWGTSGGSREYEEAVAASGVAVVAGDSVAVVAGDGGAAVALSQEDSTGICAI